MIVLLTMIFVLAAAAAAAAQARAHRAQQARQGPVFGGKEWHYRAALPLSDAVVNPEPEPVVPAQRNELEPLLQSRCVVVW